MKPMRSRFTWVVILLTSVMPLMLSAQLHDNFSDGDFNDNPEWTGDADQFIVNADFHLKLNSSGSRTSCLSTPVETAGLTEWRIWVNLAFSPSDNNNARIYLASDIPRLDEPLNGYYLKFGESGQADAIELYRQSGTADYLICRGTDGLLASPFTIRVRVVRTPNGQWKVYCDPAGGENFRLQATGSDPVWFNYGHFGIFCKYTTSNAGNFLFDDVYAGPLLVDDILPELLTAEVTGTNQVLLGFSEPMNEYSVSETAHYNADQGLGNPVTAVPDESDHSRVTLSFTKPINPGTLYHLTISGVTDLAGNPVETTTLPFALFGKGPFSVVINEIMADPDPVNGLPGHEYLELYNRSALPVKLENWELSVGGSIKDMEPCIMAPGTYLILAGEEAAPLFEPFGNVMALPGFGLLNSGTTLVLRNADKAIIHAVTYSDSWYQSEIKEGGGWSLEQGDPENPCAGSTNWRASDNLSGGTPGSVNSIAGHYPDIMVPAINRIAIENETTVRVVFNEPMDSLTIADPAAYTADRGLGNPAAVYLHPPDYRSVSLEFNGFILKGMVYELTIKAGFTDCAGNMRASPVVARFAIPEAFGYNDVVINEVLYDPRITGTDFVEVFNRSEKVVDLKNLWLATRDATTLEPASVKETCSEGRLMFPGDYLVLTSEPATVMSEYFSPYPETFAEMASLPSFPNGEGTVVLLTPGMQVIDEFFYTDNLHFPLLNTTDGVSLERVNYEQPASDPGNWHSASANVGYATPGYRNSQFLQITGSNEEISLSPEIFSPDNDGNDDILTIACNFSDPGNVVTIRIFDSNGRTVSVPVKNEPAGTTNLYTWDGVGDDNSKAPIGIYVVYVEVFNPAGKIRQFKKAAVLGGKR